MFFRLCNWRLHCIASSYPQKLARKLPFDTPSLAVNKLPIFIRITEDEARDVIGQSLLIIVSVNYMESKAYTSPAFGS